MLDQANQEIVFRFQRDHRLPGKINAQFVIGLNAGSRSANCQRLTQQMLRFRGGVLICPRLLQNLF